MKIKPIIELDQDDMGAICQMLGDAWRADPSKDNHYQSLVKHAFDSAQGIAQRAFDLGRRYAESQQGGGKNEN